MKKFFKYIKDDKVLFWSFVLSGVFLLLSTLCIGVFYQHLPPFLPLFNSLPWGYARLGDKIAFFIPVLVVWFFAAVNIILTSFLYPRIVLIARYLGATTIAASIAVFIFTIQILILIH